VSGGAFSTGDAGGRVLNFLFFTVAPPGVCTDEGREEGADDPDVRQELSRGGEALGGGGLGRFFLDIVDKDFSRIFVSSLAGAFSKGQVLQKDGIKAGSAHGGQ